MSPLCRRRPVNHALQPPAFTLIELLVVLAVLVILAAILLPSLAGSRERARTTACLANLRSLGLAFRTYAAAWDGYTLPAGYRDPASGTDIDHPIITWELWPTLLVNQQLVPPPRGQRLLKPVYPGSSLLTSSTFRCPSGLADVVASGYPLSLTDPIAERPQRSRSHTTRVTVDSWYGINGATGSGGSTPGQGNRWLPGRRIPSDGNPSDTRLPRLDRFDPAVVLLFDGIFMNQNAVDPFRVNGRHGRRTPDGPGATNLLFIAGHAESLPRRLLPAGRTRGSITIPTTLTRDFWQPTVTRDYPAAQWLNRRPLP